MTIYFFANWAVARKLQLQNLVWFACSSKVHKVLLVFTNFPRMNSDRRCFFCFFLDHPLQRKRPLRPEEMPQLTSLETPGPRRAKFYSTAGTTGCPGRLRPRTSPARPSPRRRLRRTPCGTRSPCRRTCRGWRLRATPATARFASVMPEPSTFSSRGSSSSAAWRMDSRAGWVWFGNAWLFFLAGTSRRVAKKCTSRLWAYFLPSSHLKRPPFTYLNGHVIRGDGIALKQPTYLILVDRSPRMREKLSNRFQNINRRACQRSSKLSTPRKSSFRFSCLLIRYM